MAQNSKPKAARIQFNMKIIVVGGCGRLGTAIVKKLNEKAHTICVVDKNVDEAGTAPVVDKKIQNAYFFNSLSRLPEGFCADIIIDVSTHENSITSLDFALKNGLPIVIGATGHTYAELTKIKHASNAIPVLLSSNFSLGLQYFYSAVSNLSKCPTDSITLIETHHKNKLDAPSGTATEIARVINNCGKDVNIFSIRGGGVVGIHELTFILNNEHLTLSHTADSRDTFADGAVAALEFLAPRPAGLYSMHDLINIF